MKELEEEREVNRLRQLNGNNKKRVFFFDIIFRVKIELNGCMKFQSHIMHLLMII